MNPQPTYTLSLPDEVGRIQRRSLSSHIHPRDEAPFECCPWIGLECERHGLKKSLKSSDARDVSRTLSTCTDSEPEMELNPLSLLLLPLSSMGQLIPIDARFHLWTAAIKRLNSKTSTPELAWCVYPSLHSPRKPHEYMQRMDRKSRQPTLQQRHSNPGTFVIRSPHIGYSNKPSFLYIHGIIVK